MLRAYFIQAPQKSKAQIIHREFNGYSNIDISIR